MDDNDTETSTGDKGASSDDDTSSSPLTNHRATCGRGVTQLLLVEESLVVMDPSTAIELPVVKVLHQEQIP